MATMLCQLYTNHPGQPLPESRGEIYRDFVDLLYERQQDIGLHAQARAALEECGDAALAAAESTLGHLRELIEYLAAEQYAGNTTPAVDLLASQPGAARPEEVPEKKWSTFLEASLRGSGLLTLRDGRAVFLHQTLLEYLAARHATRDALARGHAYEALNRPVRYWPWTAKARIPRGIRHRRWGHRFWTPPDTDADSFVGFLLDIGYTKATEAPLILDPILKRLATHGGLEGCAFIARQTQLGTRLPDSIIATAASTLSELARAPGLDFWAHGQAALVLAALGDPRGADALALLAQDPHLASWSREQAAEALAGIGDPRGADLLALLAQDPHLDGGWRVEAAEALAALGDPRAADPLVLLAQDPHLASRHRVRAAEALAGIGDRRGADPLALLARYLHLVGGHRVDAAAALARRGDRRGDRRGADLLALLARDPHLDGGYRVDAAAALARLGDPRGADLLALLAQDPHLDGGYRVDAAAALARLGDPYAADLLTLFAQDPDRDGFHRVRAAAALAGLGDRRGADLLALLARDPDLARGYQVDAAEALAGLGDPRAADPLALLAQDPHFGGGHRVATAVALARLGDPRGADLLALLARTDSAVSGGHGRGAGPARRPARRRPPRPSRPGPGPPQPAPQDGGHVSQEQAPRFSQMTVTPTPLGQRGATRCDLRR